MITAADARAIAEQRFGSLADDRVLVQREVPNGWEFNVQSREYLETGNFSSQLVGGLTLVLRDGSLHQFASHDLGYRAFCAAAGLPEPS